MTTEQRDELEAAVDRATREGVEVVGHGRRRSDGARLWCVPSTRDPQRWHIIVLEGRRLRCDCECARLGGRICKHAAAVHMHLTVEAERRRRLNDEIEAALREERLEAQLTESVQRLERLHQRMDAHAPVYSRESPRLADDRRAVGIFK